MVGVRNRALGPSATSLIEDRGNAVYVSSAPLWELAIEYRLGKVPLPMTPRRYAATRIEDAGFAALPISTVHGAEVGALPDIHRDPFDRLSVAQAMLENLTPITAARPLERYPIATFRATE